MTLRLSEIKLRDFRSYESFELHDLGMLTVLVGPNAIGKTNVIEGIQLLTALTSFRHATIDQLVRRGASSALLAAQVGDGERLLDISLSMEGHARHYRLNGKAKRPSDLRGLVPSVTFTPDDLDLVKGPMSTRRHAMDVLGAQVNANYYQILKDYEKVVRHKNRLLKEEASDTLLAAIDEMLVTCGAQLTCYRHALAQRLRPYLKERYEAIASNRESFDLWYVPSWGKFDVDDLREYAFDRNTARECLARAIEERRQEEKARHRAVVGPHADVLEYTIDGMPAGMYGSQGQQRSIVLSFKLAEAEVVEEISGQKPILLLDDVMSELDGTRREALVGYMSRDVQTFVTTANLAYFSDEMLDAARVVELPLA